MVNGSGGEGPTQVSLKGRHRLPERKPVVVNVLRFSFGRAVFLLLVLASTSFLVGVAAGTSGHYREFALWATDWMSESSRLKQLALWPDRLADKTPSLSDRLANIEASVEDGLALARAESRQIADRYSLQAEGLLEFRGAVGTTRDSCRQAAQQGNEAARYSWDARQQVEILQATIALALQACQAGAEVGAPPESPQETLQDN